MDARRWFQVIPAFFIAQTPDTALRIIHLQERKAERMSMKQEKNMGSWINQHPGRPDYKADSRRVNGQYRNSRMVCRTANLPRRARRGV